MRHLFPKVVSYNRFVELEKEVAIPLALFIKKVLLGKCTGISFVDSTPLNINVTYNRGEDLSQASYLPDEIKRRIFWRFAFYLLPLQRNNQYPTIMKLRLLSTLSLILCCVGSVLAYNLKYVRGLSNSSVLSIAQRPSGEMLFGTCDGLNSYDGNGMWLTAQNTGVILYGNLVEDVKTVGGSMWVLTNYGLNIMSPMGSKVDYYEQFKGLRKIRCNPSGDGFLLHDGHLWFLDKKGRFQSVSLGSIRQNEVCDFSLSDGRLYVFLHDRIVRYVVRKTDSGYDVGRGKTIATMTIKMATADDDVEYLPQFGIK